MRRVPIQAMRMPKAWPVLASALNDQLGWWQVRSWLIGSTFIEGRWLLKKRCIALFLNSLRNFGSVNCQHAHTRIHSRYEELAEPAIEVSDHATGPLKLLFQPPAALHFEKPPIWS